MLARWIDGYGMIHGPEDRLALRLPVQEWAFLSSRRALIFQRTLHPSSRYTACDTAIRK